MFSKVTAGTNQTSEKKFSDAIVLGDKLFTNITLKKRLKIVNEINSCIAYH